MVVRKLPIDLTYAAPVLWRTRDFGERKVHYCVFCRAVGPFSQSVEPRPSNAYSQLHSIMYFCVERR